MKNLLNALALSTMLITSPLVHAQAVESVQRTLPVEATDSGFVLLDVLLYRPAGFVATVVGGAIFVGMSPLTAFASIPAPHDAFKKTFNILVLAPATYTFVRPIGDRRFTGYLPHHANKANAQQWDNRPTTSRQTRLPNHPLHVTPYND